MSDQPTDAVLRLTTQVVSAYLSNNATATDALAPLIRSVHQSLASVAALEPESAAPQPPAVPVRKSVFLDFIVCLEDGKKLKMLKRHLGVSYGLTPDAYRAKWGLPSDYPMVAPSYASKRSALASKSDWARMPSAESSEPEAVQPDKPEITMVPARRARGSKG